MKAMILAAGLATRLRPYTDHTPKALFPLAGRPLIDRIIDRLAEAGCTGVVVNTHHLADRIESHLTGGVFPVPVSFRREKRILGTGGGIRNALDFFEGAPFLVVNGDIDCDIDYADLYRHHLSHPHPATLVLTDCPDFNTVSVAANGRIVGFDPAPGKVPEPPAGDAEGRPLSKRTFAGIQVLDPAVPALLPADGFSSIIDAYRTLIAQGRTVAGYRFDGRWADLGTPQRYIEAAVQYAARRAFARMSGEVDAGGLRLAALAGGGSQRRWYRATAAGRSMVLVSHGIRKGSGVEEVDAFVDIGRHLKASGVPVPDIYGWDRFSGLVFVEDMGDVHLQTAANSAGPEEALPLYRRVIDAAVQMGFGAADGFDPAWTWQSPRYDRDLILEKECRYFSEAFVAGHLGRPNPFPELAAEFGLLADRIEENAAEGFIHRDLQSRNIMICGGEIRIIDFQGGRTGPVQYDLASLLIDPYVNLPAAMRDSLAEEAVDRLCGITGEDRKRALAGYRYCALSRNLQILGAFGFLTARGKTGFASAIPGALAGLNRVLADLPEEEFAGLRALAAEIMAEMPKLPIMG